MVAVSSDLDLHDCNIRNRLLKAFGWRNYAIFPTYFLYYTMRNGNMIIT